MKARKQNYFGRKAISFMGIIAWLISAAFLPTQEPQIPTLQVVGDSQIRIQNVDPSAREAVETFFDGIIPRQLENNHIPGAAVALVKDGRLVFSKGYGFADVAQKLPVSAENTMFRTGSVAKLFVWTAVLQLAEQGKLDLNTDINNYLPEFQIPATYAEPITLSNLMTHTAGFEDAPIGAMRASVSDLEPLENYLASRIPARVYPPGQITAYSNYGCALASHIVENISGLSFDDYIESNIINPLGMDKTTFRQPVLEGLTNHLAKGYRYNAGEFQEQPFEVFEVAPAGGASASVTDIAKFMLVHLSGGSYNGIRILDGKTEREMLERHYSNDPRLTGVAYGFYEIRINNRLLLTHGGETMFFRSQMFLLPEENLGMYVVYNAIGNGGTRLELAKAFFDKFYPTREVSNQPPSLQTEISNPTWLNGLYISSRSPQSTLAKVAIMLDPFYQPISIVSFKDGSLKISDPLKQSLNPAGSPSASWVIKEHDFYQKADGTDRLVVHSDETGNINLFFDSNPMRGYRKLAWHEEILYQIWFPGGLALILMGLMIYAFIDRKSIKSIRILTVSAGFTTLLFFSGLAGFGLLAYMPYLYGKIYPIWYLLFALPILLIGVSLGLLLKICKVGVLNSLPYTFVFVATTGLVYWLNYWNLLGWRF